MSKLTTIFLFIYFLGGGERPSWRLFFSNALPNAYIYNTYTIVIKSNICMKFQIDLNNRNISERALFSKISVYNIINNPSKQYNRQCALKNYLMYYFEFLVDEIVPIRKKCFVYKFIIKWTKVYVIHKIRYYNTEQIDIAPAVLLLITTCITMCCVGFIFYCLSLYLECFIFDMFVLFY